jgi:hypothetical protein
MEEDQSDVYDNNLEYVTEPTIPIPTEEISQPQDNNLIETDFDSLY